MKGGAEAAAAEVDAGESAEVDDKPEKPAGRGKAPLEGVSAIKEMRSEEGQSVADWVRTVAPHQSPVQIAVTRRKPERHRGVKCDGLVGKFDELVDDIEDRIREEHGGGTFLIQIKVPRAKGTGFQFLTARQIEIPGDPKVDHLRDTEPAAAGAPAGAASAASDKIIERVVGRALDIVDRPPAAPAAAGGDPAVMAMLANLQRSLEAKDKQIQALMERQATPPAPPKEDGFRDKMLDKLLDGENARITTLRATHESEMAQARQAAVDLERRLRDQFERDIKSIEDRHAREVAALERANNNSNTALGTANSTQKLVLEGQLRSLERENERIAKELAELRGRKDKSILEQAADLEKLKEALGIDGDGKEDEGKIEKVIKILGDSKIAAALLAKIGGGEKEEPGLPPAGTPYMYKGRMVVRDGDGVMHALPQRQRQRQRPPGQAQGQGAATGTSPPPGETQSPPAPEPPKVNVSPVEVAAALQYLEQAYRNDVAPDTVAASVRSMVPAGVVAAIRDLGVDDFLTKVAKLEATSPLATQKGRNFARKVGKALLDGGTQ